MLADATPQDQKQMLGERIFPLIQRQYPDLAGKITGMLLVRLTTEQIRLMPSLNTLMSLCRRWTTRSC